MKPIRSCIFFLLIVCSQLASETQAQAVFDTLAKNKDLENLVISASRFYKPKDRVLQSVQMIQSERINNISVGTLADLLAQTGLAFVQKSQLGGGSPVIRGFEANKVLLVIDGVRMNNAIYRGGHLQNILTIDPYSLDRLELLQGPSAVMYGSDALGGVIHMRTKSLSLRDRKGFSVSGHATTRFASASNEVMVHGEVHMAGRDIASYTSFTISDYGDLKQGSRGTNRFPGFGMRYFFAERINGHDSMVANKNPLVQKGTAYRQADMVQKILFKTGSWLHEWNMQYSVSSDIPRYDRLSETNAAGKLKQAEWYYGPAQRAMLFYRLTPQKATWFDQSNIILSYQYQAESRHNRNFGGNKLNHRFEKVNTFSLNADFSKRYASGEWKYGVEWVMNKVRSTAHYDQLLTGEQGILDTRYPDGGSGTGSAAIYAGQTQSITKQLSWDVGMRVSNQYLHARFLDKSFFPFPFNEVSQRSWVLTGTMGLIWQPTREWTMKAQVSNGFRTPNMDDLAKVFESANGTLIIPNPSLKPEKTRNLEWTTIYRPFKGTEITMTAWVTSYRQVLTIGDSRLHDSSQVMYDGQLSTVKTTINAARARLWGIECHALTRISKRFLFRADITRTSGRILETVGTSPLDHIPPMYGNLSLQFKRGRFESELGFLFQSAKDSADYRLGAEDNEIYSADPVRGYTASWQTVSIRQSVDLNKHMRLQLSVENLFDRFYRTFSSGISAPGRNIIASLQCRW